MIIREKWLKKIRPFYESELVKVIIGIRRCGKSVVSEFLFFKPFFLRSCVVCEVSGIT
ncbi:MAG: hypothetical protein SOZ84_09645 [Treponema sp.]|nr:hypothetical protein [Treponema sp.]